MKKVLDNFMKKFREIHRQAKRESKAWVRKQTGIDLFVVIQKGIQVIERN